MDGHRFNLRAVVRPHIVSLRRKELKTIFTGQNLVFELTQLEFLLIGALYQVNITYVLLFLELAVRHGSNQFEMYAFSVLVCIAYVFLTVILGMPLFMLFTFMSSYSKMSYLKFWECVPLFKGLGYSLAFIRICLETSNVAMAAFALLLLFNYFNGNMEKGFRTCTYNTTKNCVGMFPSQLLEQQCPNSSEYVLTSSQTFVRYVEKNYTTVILKNFLNVEWFLFVTVVWLLVFFSSIYGIRYVRKIAIIVQVFAGFIMFMMCIFIMALIPWSTISETRLLEREADTSVMNFNFWVDMILHSTEINAVSNMIWLGTIKPKALHPKHAAIIISPLKLVVFILLKCMFLCLVKETIVHYKYNDNSCFKYNSKDFFFTLVPDILFRTNIYNLFVPLWYFCLFLYAFCAPVYSVIGLVDSVVQNTPSLCRYKIYMHLAICGLSFLFTILVVTKLGEEVNRTWVKCSMPIITSMLLLLVNLAILFTYSTKEVIIDHMFTYGKPPEKYWITLWKTAPIFAIFGFILVTHNEYMNEDCTQKTGLVILSHMSSGFTFLPVVVVLVMTCFTHIKDRALQNLSNPSPDWGPYDPKKWEEKKLFFPERDIRYRNEDLKCKHKCVVRKNQDFQAFLEENEKKLAQLEANYLMDNHYK